MLHGWDLCWWKSRVLTGVHLQYLSGSGSQAEASRYQGRGSQTYSKILGLLVLGWSLWLGFHGWQWPLSMSLWLNRLSGVSSTYHFLREHLHLVVTQDIPNHHPCGPSADPGCHYVPPSWTNQGESCGEFIYGICHLFVKSTKMLQFGMFGIPKCSLVLLGSGVSAGHVDGPLQSSHTKEDPSGEQSSGDRFAGEGETTWC